MPETADGLRKAPMDQNSPKFARASGRGEKLDTGRGRNRLRRAAVRGRIRSLPVSAGGLRFNLDREEVP